MSRGKYGGLIVAAVCLAAITSCFSEEKIATYKQELDLVCTTDASKILWKLNGTDITTRKDFAKEFSVLEHNNTLRLLKVEPSTVGVGDYTCTDESTGTEIMSFDIKVLPYVTSFDKARNVIEGDPLSLECKAWGVPAPVITWSRNGTQIVKDESGKISFKKNPEGSGSSARFPSLENATLRIEQMKYEEGGNYTCFATNDVDGFGELNVANATVLVQIKDKYAALWPFLGICVEVAVLCTIILIYEKRRAKRIEEEERQEEAAHLNANNDTKTPLAGEDVRQRK